MLKIINKNFAKMLTNDRLQFIIKIDDDEESSHR